MVATMLPLQRHRESRKKRNFGCAVGDRKRALATTQKVELLPTTSAHNAIIARQTRRRTTMALLNILHHPDPRLRTKAKPVVEFSAPLAKLADDMLETMYAAPGIGLAATQVNVHRRLIVVDVSENNDNPYVLVNPKLELFGNKVAADEGCLSVPGVYERVERAESINVTAQDVNGEPLAFSADGLLAICIQHECDHLEGKLFVDYLSSLKRNRINKKLRQLAVSDNS